MNATPRSPKITRLAWGRLEVEGGHSFRDAKLYPGGAETWDWTVSGTHHEPGIRPADVEDLLARGVEVVILSQGMDGRLQVCPETLELLDDRGISVHILKTVEAVALYNDIRDASAAGGLFHSTC